MPGMALAKLPRPKKAKAKNSDGGNFNGDTREIVNSKYESGDRMYQRLQLLSRQKHMRRFHMIENSDNPVFFPGKLRILDKVRPQMFLMIRQAHALDIPVFMKEALLPIMEKSQIIQELPRAFRKVLEEQRRWRK